MSTRIIDPREAIDIIDRMTARIAELESQLACKPCGCKPAPCCQPEYKEVLVDAWLGAMGNICVTKERIRVCRCGT